MSTTILRPGELQQIAIDRGVFTQPIITHGAAELEVSISHCDEFGVALAYPHAFPMGVDVERVSSERMETMESVFTVHERAELAGMTDNDRRSFVTVALWTAKEALSKVLRCGLTCPFQIFSIKQLQHQQDRIEGYFENFYQYRFLSLRLFGSHVITLVFPRTSAITLSVQQVEGLLL